MSLENFFPNLKLTGYAVTSPATSAYNCIAWAAGMARQRPDELDQELFLTALTRLKVKATLRREKGQDIDAACGQLRLKTAHAFQNVTLQPS